MPILDVGVQSILDGERQPNGITSVKGGEGSLAGFRPGERSPHRGGVGEGLHRSAGVVREPMRSSARFPPCTILATQVPGP